MKKTNDIEGLRFILLQDGVDPEIVKKMTIEEVRQAFKFEDEVMYNSYMSCMASKYRE